MKPSKNSTSCFYNSVRTHARSDVPVGSFLSGGYDSSAIVYYMSRFNYVPSTFSIGFEGWNVSEHLYAGMVAKQYHTNHHSLILETQSLDIIDHLVWVYDEPNGDISIIPTYLVSKEAAKSVKAVMSGEGADEILVGYQWQKEYRPKSNRFNSDCLDVQSRHPHPIFYSIMRIAWPWDGLIKHELKKLCSPSIIPHPAKPGLVLCPKL